MQKEQSEFEQFDLNFKYAHKRIKPQLLSLLAGGHHCKIPEPDQKARARSASYLLSIRGEETGREKWRTTTSPDSPEGMALECILVYDPAYPLLETDPGEILPQATRKAAQDGPQPGVG